MAFKTEGSERESMSEINVTPLVDVMLVLLVVFIVTAPLLTQAVKVDLPKTEKTDPAPDDHIATLSIDAQGVIHINDQIQTLEGLGANLSTFLQADPEFTLRLDVDKAVNYGHLAEVMAIAHNNGITRLAFVSRQ
jgi:biopolymer transport protein ExbD